MVWDWPTIEHIEEVKMILLNRANRRVCQYFKRGYEWFYY